VNRLRQLVRAIIGLLGETYCEWRNDRVVRLGAGLAYYALFGIVPLLVILVAVAGLLFSTQEVQSFLVEALDGFVQGDVEALAAGLAEELDGSLTGLGLIGAATLLFAASLVFAALQDALNVIWHAPVRAGIENTIRNRVLAFSVVLLAAAVVIAGLLVDAVVGIAEAIVPGNVQFVESLAGLITAASSWVLGIGAITLVFRLLPYVKVRWQDALIGGGVTALMIVAGSALFSVYFSKYGTASISAVAGSLVLFLLWIYSQAQIFLAGAELTKVLGLRSKRAESP
jgi:membrane protein